MEDVQWETMSLTDLLTFMAIFRDETRNEISRSLALLWDRRQQIDSDNERLLNLERQINQPKIPASSKVLLVDEWTRMRNALNNVRALIPEMRRMERELREVNHNQLLMLSRMETRAQLLSQSEEYSTPEMWRVHGAGISFMKHWLPAPDTVRNDRPLSTPVATRHNPHCAIMIPPRHFVDNRCGHCTRAFPTPNYVTCNRCRRYTRTHMPSGSNTECRCPCQCPPPDSPTGSERQDDHPLAGATWDPAREPLSSPSPPISPVQLAAEAVEAALELRELELPLTADEHMSLNLLHPDHPDAARGFPLTMQVQFPEIASFTTGGGMMGLVPGAILDDLDMVNRRARCRVCNRRYRWSFYQHDAMFQLVVHVCDLCHLPIRSTDNPVAWQAVWERECGCRCIHRDHINVENINVAGADPGPGFETIVLRQFPAGS